MGLSASYSELEYLILAMVGDGTSSGYAMRKKMNRMRGGRWSSESGSVYRVVRRLQKDGLVAEARKAGLPNRERTEYVLTGEGERKLQDWLILPPDRTELAFLIDPLRTRSYFLGRLAQADRIRVVKTWLLESKRFVADLKKEIDGTTYLGAVQKAGYENLLFLAEARHEWLRRLSTIVKMSEPATPEPS